MQEGDPGKGQQIAQWTTMTFEQPFNVGITVVMQQSQVTVFTPEGGAPQWSAPYPSGSVSLSFEQILALPSADAFFGELFQAADQVLLAQTAEATQGGPPPPDPIAPE